MRCSLDIIIVVLSLSCCLRTKSGDLLQDFLSNVCAYITIERGRRKNDDALFLVEKTTTRRTNVFLRVFLFSSFRATNKRTSKPRLFLDALKVSDASFSGFSRDDDEEGRREAIWRRGVKKNAGSSLCVPPLRAANKENGQSDALKARRFLRRQILEKIASALG